MLDNQVCPVTIWLLSFRWIKKRKNLILMSEMGGVYDVQNDNDDNINITKGWKLKLLGDILR